MLSRSGHVFCWTAYGISAATPSFGASSYDAPPSLTQTVKCMVGVLKTTHNVYDVKVGVINYHNWAQSFVQYQYQGENRNRGTVRFVELRPDGLDREVSFHTMLGGLFGGTDSGPPDLGTAEITHKWKERCRVNADVLFE
jgi:hypothetical protein